MHIDAHQHFWSYSPEGYPWITEEMQVIRRDFHPADLWQAQKAVGFQGSIAVQAQESLAETYMLLALSEQDDRIKGVVGWVDLGSQDVSEHLENLSKHPKLVGIRMILQTLDPDYLYSSDFRKGLALLKEYSLTYDLLLYPHHLPAAIDLVADFPNQAFVLDHLAKPLIKDQILLPWQKNIRILAAYPNVSCKLSGMLTEADWYHWKTEDFRPYLDTIWEAFGEDRLMIGSDWPVCLLAATYQQCMELVLSYLEAFSVEVRQKVLGLNCLRFYGVGE